MIHIVPLEDLIVPEYRQRSSITDFSVIELADDILLRDLIHPLTIRADDPPTLVTGGRRLEAIKMLHRKGQEFYHASVRVPPGCVPCIRLTPREELGYLEAEFSENHERLDLTWQEKTAAKARLHELRTLANENQTVTDTAKELATPGTSPETARISLTDDLLLSKHLDKPEVASAKSKSEASRIVKRILREEHNASLRDSIHLTSTSHKLYHGEACTAIRERSEVTYDLVLTDPPYGIGANTFGDQTFINHTYNDSYEHWSGLMQDFADASYHACHEKAHAYVFCDINRFADLKRFFEGVGWKAWARPLIWYKGNLGTLPRPDHGPRYTYEAILFASKGDMEIQKVGMHDVLTHATSAKPRHAAEKPVDLFVDLIERSVGPGATVLDPFCGSGTIFPAANRTSCFATGIELDEVAHNIAATRMEEK